MCRSGRTDKMESAEDEHRAGLLARGELSKCQKRTHWKHDHMTQLFLHKYIRFDLRVFVLVYMLKMGVLKV